MERIPGAGDLSDILERLNITFTSNGKHEFVPRD